MIWRLDSQDVVAIGQIQQALEFAQQSPSFVYQNPRMQKLVVEAITVGRDLMYRIRRQQRQPRREAA